METSAGEQVTEEMIQAVEDWTSCQMGKACSLVYFTSPIILSTLHHLYVLSTSILRVPVPPPHE